MPEAYFGAVRRCLRLLCLAVFYPLFIAVFCPPSIAVFCPLSVAVFLPPSIAVFCPPSIAVFCPLSAVVFLPPSIAVFCPLSAADRPQRLGARSELPGRASVVVLTLVLQDGPCGGIYGIFVLNPVVIELDFVLGAAVLQLQLRFREEC